MNYWRVLSLTTAFSVLSTFSDVVINEIHYDPPVKTERSEFIELFNTSASAVVLSGWQLSGGVEFTFPAGSSIPANGYALVAGDPVAFKARFGGTAQGPWTGSLANEGESITLRDSTGVSVDKVTYKLGFPWPTIGDPPGYSIELVNPAFDNDLGGNWRRSVRGNPSTTSTTLIPKQSSWSYRKGTSEPSSPIAAWRDLGFVENGWSTGTSPIGYDPAVALGTTLADMNGNYTSFYLRKKFQVTDPSAIGSLTLETLYDDGIQVWINGKRVVNSNLPDRDVAYNELSTGAARESAEYDPFIINSPGAILRPGENVIAVQVHNLLFSTSSDCFFDLRLSALLGSPNSGPTPGARNSVFDTNLPPIVRQVDHLPEQPKAGEPVIVTAKITDSDGVSGVNLQYQVVEPGSYIQLNDPNYELTWTSVQMVDNGSNGDAQSGDSIYTVTLPGSLQVHRRLIRYRIVASDAGNRSVRAPYEDDPTPNFAYFVYNGIPGWQAAVQPGSTGANGQVQNFSAAEMGRLPSYHLLSKRSSVEDCTWNSKYGGDLYRWWGTLVYDGKVYDHIRYRARGGVWRYAMGKNMWKFDLNRGHEFEARDNYGRKYKTTWKKVNLGANIQQAQFSHRGEQGMFESVGFALFNLAGVEAPKTHWINFRVIDDANETPVNNQYGGDYWGLYLAIEQEDGRFLDEHDLPDGNLYKMEGGTGELNNQGRTAATDKSDLNTFQAAYQNGTQTEAWWRQNFDVDRYYSYHTIVQGIHHYDICDGKNYFYFLNPEDRKWSVHTWDLDLTWADNMYRDCDGDDPFRTRVVQRAPFDIEYKNRVRELRDLLYNTDQAWKLIDEFAGIVKGTNAGPNILAADRSMWDYNPVMVNSSIVQLNQAGHGRFYIFPLESVANKGAFEAAPALMKAYIVKRSTLLDQRSADSLIPAKPQISYAGPAGFPLNRIELRSSPFAGAGSFSAMKWRVGEIRDAKPGVPGLYEVEAIWDSAALPAFNETVVVPAERLKVGHTYRARVRMKDSTGRWSNWSAPLEFTAGEPDNSTALQQNLQPAEIMYNSPAGSDFEYIELHNRSADQTLQLGGVAFTEGIDFVFPTGASLAPSEYCLVVKSDAAGDFSTFRQFYNVPAGTKIFGPYGGNLNNAGERLTLKTGTAGAEIFSFSFNNSAGWPTAPDGTGHSLALTEAASNRQNPTLEYPGNWRGSTFIKGSPGRVDPAPTLSIVINEFAAHTDFNDPAYPDYTSNDWIELYNRGPAAPLRNLYLSDDAQNLKKWQLPDTNLPQNGRITFDEINGFHTPMTNGFGLNKTGEDLFLSSLPGTAEDRVLDSIRFKGQENGITTGRYPDGEAYFYRSQPTRNAPNEPASADLRITEIMYHPLETPDGLEDASREFVELYNPTTRTINLWNTNGAYRIAGGLSFTFSTNSTQGVSSIPPQGVLVLVNFDPSNATETDRFLTYYQLNRASINLAGPFTGRLANASDRVAIEKPQAPDLPGDPISWIVIDEAIYTDESGADGTGDSLNLANLSITADNPSNLTPKLPTPGTASFNVANDLDGDGMPDDWETRYGLNPNDASDAAKDNDADGFSNLQEYLAGTDPLNATSRLELRIVSSGQGSNNIQFTANPEKTYTIQFRDQFNGSPWRNLREVSGTAGVFTLEDATQTAPQRYYRLVTQ